MSEVLRTLRQIGRATAFVGQLGVPAMGALPPLSTADILPNQPEHAVKPVVWQASSDYLNNLQPVKILLPVETSPIIPPQPSAPEKQEQIQIVCLGDVNGDGQTDLKDVEMVESKEGKPPETFGEGLFLDINGDGTIDKNDADIVRANLGCQEEPLPPLAPTEVPSGKESDQITRYFQAYNDRISALSPDNRFRITAANGGEIFLYNLTGRPVVEGRLLHTIWLLANEFAGTSMNIYRTDIGIVQINSQRQSFEAMTFVALAGSDELPFWSDNPYGQTIGTTDETGRTTVASYAADRGDIPLSQITVAELCQALVGFDSYQEVGCMSIAHAVQSALAGIRYVDYEDNLSNMYLQTQEGPLIYYGKVSYDLYMKFADLGPMFAPFR
jgi:hypothetical protein